MMITCRLQKHLSVGHVVRLRILTFDIMADNGANRRQRWGRHVLCLWLYLRLWLCRRRHLLESRVDVRIVARRRALDHMRITCSISHGHRRIHVLWRRRKDICSLVIGRTLWGTIGTEGGARRPISRLLYKLKSRGTLWSIGQVWTANLYALPQKDFVETV